MDEQMTTQQTQEVSNPEPQHAPSNSLANTSQENQQASETSTTQPEISINEDGEVNFSDEYLADIEKSFFGDKPPEQDTQPQPEVQQVQQQPTSFYTDEELASIPFEQWDPSRLNGDIKKYVPIVQQQFANRNIRQQQEQNAQQAPDFLKNQPKQYTPKELSDAALKLACERLGLEDTDDFDTYEGEHKAALDLARQELLSTRQQEITDYGRRAADWQQLQNFNRELAARPDFHEFNNWYISGLKQRNTTPDQVSKYLMQRVAENGYDFGIITQTVSDLYREFLQSKAQTQTQRPKAPMPPKLESTRGGYDGGGRSVNLKDFGNMDLDAQAQALIKMGYVL